MSEKPLGAGDPAFKGFFCIRGFVEKLSSFPVQKCQEIFG